MRRPFMTVGFSALTSLALAAYFGVTANAVMGGVLLIAAFLSLFGPGKRLRVGLFAALFTAGLSFGISILADVFYYGPVAAHAGEHVVVMGVATEPERTDGGMTVVPIRVTTPLRSGEATGYLVRLYSFSAADVDVGDRVEVLARLSEVPGQSVRPAKAKRLFLHAFAEGEITVTRAERTTVSVWLYRLRASLVGAVRRVLPGVEGELAAGIAFGDQSGIGDEAVEAFRASGLVHLLSFSATHLMLVISLLSGMLALAKAPNRVTAVASALMAFMLAGLTGFTPAALRAAMMVGITCLGELVGREQDRLNTLGFAALVLLLPNPYAAADVGLLLSFTSVLGITLWAKPMEAWMLLRWARLGALLRRAEPPEVDAKAGDTSAGSTKSTARRVIASPATVDAADCAADAARSTALKAAASPAAPNAFEPPAVSAESAEAPESPAEAKEMSALRVGRGARFVAGNLAVSFAALVGTLPVMMLFFGRVSVIAPVANLLAAPVLPVLLPAAILTGVFGALGLAPLASACGFAAGLLSKLLVWVAEGTAAMPFSQLSMDEGYLTIWMLGTMALFGLAFWLRFQGGMRLAAALSVMVLVIAVFSQRLLMTDVARVRVLSENGGTHAVVSLSGRTALFGGVSKRGLIYSIGRLNPRTPTDLWVLTELPLSGLGDARQVIETTRPAAVMAPESVTSELPRVGGGKVWACGDLEILLWEDSEVSVISQTEEEAARLRMGEARVLMLWGEVDAAMLPEGFEICDLLILEGKVPGNLEKIRASHAIICDNDRRATLTLMLSGLGTNVINPADDGGGLEALLDTNTGRLVVRR